MSSACGLGSSRRYIIIESDLSSGDFSQLSFTSEYSLTGNGSRSSRSASSNVSSRIWDFSRPEMRESSSLQTVLERTFRRKWRTAMADIWDFRFVECQLGTHCV